MGIYDINSFTSLVSGNSYVGRGIVAGMTSDGKYAAAAYFIMGRSENSRNRIFVEKEGGEIEIRPFDPSKVKDPSLIIYSPVRKYKNRLIVTNGDQTDTVYDHLAKGKSFSEALSTRQFEPDDPNFTPRISALFTFENGGFSYEMNILKSADAAGSACNRFTFSYSPLPGTGHFIHTYNHDGNPIPTFTGEPERVAVCSDIDTFTDEIWNALDENNRISLYTRFVSLSDGTEICRMINKNKTEG